ncbi:HAMP domain-containing protein [Pseudoxanthomonas sp. NC8]|nr:HAMP domain-containing protein [Pseudoxanthomonas sp. NC8]
MQTLIDSVDDRDQVEGTQLIMSADGDLIAHPQLRQRIAAADGQLKLSSLHDPLLEQVHRMIASAGTDGGARRTPDGSYWVAWAKIHGPGWYQVHVIPQSQFSGLLMWCLVALCGLGVVALLPAMWLLRRRVHHLVTGPLQRLTDAVDELGHGGEPGPIELRGEDELARLTGAFNAMVAELTQQHGLQIAHAGELQAEVDVRRRVMTHLEEERARLLALLGAMNLGILFVGDDNRVIYCNAAFLSTWSIPGDTTLPGRTTREALELAAARMSEPEAVVQRLELSIQSPDNRDSFEIQLRDGRVVMHYSYPVRDAQDRHIGHLWGGRTRPGPADRATADRPWPSAIR